MFYNLLIWFLIWNWNTVAQESFQIEDIPIEHYGHDEHQNDEIDVELIPLIPRSPKRFNFNGLTNLDSHESRRVQEYFQELTQPTPPRPKRDIIKAKSKYFVANVDQTAKIATKDENSTEPFQNISTTKLQEKHQLVSINDFIRFKRSLIENNQRQMELLSGAGKFIQANPSESITGVDKLADRNDNKDVTRETRGATKEQWVKQAYPVVQRDDASFDDNVHLSSDSVRGPRVHFVTNGMKEKDPLEYTFDRLIKSRSINKYSPSDLSAEMDYYQPRFARNYGPRDRNYERYSNGERDVFRQDYRPENPQSYYDSNYNINNKNNRKRRIIYYATLPEISRNSRDDFRYYNEYDKYGYRDEYIEPDRYMTRKRFYDRPRYQEDEPLNANYPVKVSTDVKVREVKKNPERRVYSDVDRTRYNHD